MDDYDPRRLPAFQDKSLRLSPEELAALASVDPTLTEEELKVFADDRPRTEEWCAIRR